MEPLRRDRNFLLFWVVQGLSFAGDSFTYVALPLLVLEATGSVLQMGLLTGTAGAAWLVVGVFAGVVVDRFDRRTLMIIADVARAVLYGIVPLVWLFDPQVWVLYVVMPLGAAFGMLSQVAYVTAIPALVGKERVTEANGRAVGDVRVGRDRRPAARRRASPGCSAPRRRSASTRRRSRWRRSAWRSCGSARRATATGAAGVPWRSFAVGARFLWRHPALRSLTLLLACVLFLTYGLTDVFIYYLKHDLGRTDGTVGYVLAIAAAGHGRGRHRRWRRCAGGWASGRAGSARTRSAGSRSPASAGPGWCRSSPGWSRCSCSARAWPARARCRCGRR